MAALCQKKFLYKHESELQADNISRCSQTISVKTLSVQRVLGLYLLPKSDKLNSCKIHGTFRVKQGQKFVAVGAESRYLAFTATNRDI